MALDVALADERGARIDGVGDVPNVLGRLLPPADDRSFRCLGFIDLYGDTVFNRLQMGELLTELTSGRRQRQPTKENCLTAFRISHAAAKSKPISI